MRAFVSSQSFLDDVQQPENDDDGQGHTEKPKYDGHGWFLAYCISEGNRRLVADVPVDVPAGGRDPLSRTDPVSTLSNLGITLGSPRSPILTDKRGWR